MPETAKELFEHELRDIYDAEKKLVRATQSMAKKVSDKELSNSLMQHSKVTEKQAARLEKVFGSIGRRPRREKCKGIDGLIEEFTSFVKDEKPSREVLDVFATGAGMKVEHYEMVSYRSLISLATELGLNDAVSLFEQTLNEEQEAAEQLETASQRLGKKLDPGD